MYESAPLNRYSEFKYNFRIRQWGRHEIFSLIVVVLVTNSITLFKTSLFFVGFYFVIFKVGAFSPCRIMRIT